jgi:hypothetical protein
VFDIANDNSSPLVGSPAYIVQSPEGSHGMEKNNEARVEMEEEVSGEEELRFKLRKSSSDKETILDKAINRMKKRSFEGNIETGHFIQITPFLCCLIHKLLKRLAKWV